MFCELSLFWGYLGEFLLWIAAVLTFITGYQYYQKSLDYVKAEEAKKVHCVKEVVVEAKPVETPQAKPVAAKKPVAKTAAKKAPTKKTAAKKTTTKKSGTAAKAKTVAAKK